MTRQAWARLAGFMFLFYIATVLPGAILFEQAAAGDGMAGQLASIADHALQVRVAILLTMLGTFNAIVLGAALYAITRDEDHDLALFALVCRVGEGVINTIPTLAVVAMLWLATAPPEAAADTAAVDILGRLLLNLQGWTMLVGATVFAVGSTVYAYLFLRARSIPVPLAWLGIVASVILVIGLPLSLVGYLSGPVTMWMWLPMVLFEIPLGVWLLVKAVPDPEPPAVLRGQP